jgi:hypothetical protein
MEGSLLGASSELLFPLHVLSRVICYIPRIASGSTGFRAGARRSLLMGMGQNCLINPDNIALSGQKGTFING